MTQALNPNLANSRPMRSITARWSAMLSISSMKSNAAWPDSKTSSPIRCPLVLRFRTDEVSCHRALAFLIDHRLEKISQPPPHAWVGNPRERTRDPDPFRRAQCLGDGE